jgi:hypothetical protein
VPEVPVVPEVPKVLVRVVLDVLVPIVLGARTCSA